MANAAGGRAIHRGGTPWEVRVVGPGRVSVSLADHEDGVTTVRYTPRCSGLHHVYVRLGEEQVAGSPFDVAVDVVPLRATSVLHLVAASQRSLRGLYTRWLLTTRKLGVAGKRIPLYAMASRPAVKPRAASNATAISAVQVRAELWSRAVPQLVRWRLRRGMEAMRVRRARASELRGIAANVCERKTIRVTATAWRVFVEACTARAQVRHQQAEVLLPMSIRFDRIRQLRYLFAAWAVESSERCAEQDAEAERASVADARARSRRLAVWMQEWKTARRELARDEKRFRRADAATDRHLARRRLQSLVAVFALMRQQSEARAGATRELHLLRFRLDHRRKWKLGCALRSWLSFVSVVEHEARLQARADKGGARGPHRQRRLRDAMREWQSCLVQRTDADAKVDTNVKRRSDIRMRAALYGWVLHRGARSSARTTPLTPLLAHTLQERRIEGKGHRCDVAHMPPRLQIRSRSFLLPPCFLDAPPMLLAPALLLPPLWPNACGNACGPVVPQARCAA